MLTTNILLAEKYDYLSEKFKKAFTFLRDTDLAALPVGNVPIDGNEVYANVQSYSTMDAADCPFESHKEYFDVQYVVEGEECFGYEPVENLIPSVEYDAEKDLIFYQEPADFGSVILKAGDFALDKIRQIPGMRSIVSAVYDVKPGEVWPEESIKHLVDECAANGLVFDVVESIPVTEEIKLGRPERDRHIENYCESIQRCAKYGIKCITYNFMPVFDWTRTQLDKEAEDGSTSLVMYWDQLKGLDPLKDDIHLPGWDASYTQDEVRELIRAYGELGEEGLWANIEYFLKRVIPVAEECDVVMALHPDDPPYPIFGLPRVITCEKNIDRYLSIVDSPANSLCLCTGSLGSSPDNDIPAMVRKYSAMGRIGFMHIRNVKILPDTSFEESGHLTQKGSLDMNAIVKALVETGFEGYFRPDHGRMIWGESGKPGYGLFDRALGSAYINGLIEANGGVIEE